MRDTKPLCTIDVPVHCWPVWRYLWSLQRRDTAKVLWMDKRAEDGRAAGRSVLCRDQALGMPRHRGPGDKHLRPVPSSLACSQSDSRLRRTCFIFDTFPVCHVGSMGTLFLSLPEVRSSFHFYWRYSFFPVHPVPAAPWRVFFYCASQVSSTHSLALLFRRVGICLLLSWSSSLRVKFPSCWIHC